MFLKDVLAGRSGLRFNQSWCLYGRTNEEEIEMQNLMVRRKKNRLGEKRGVAGNYMALIDKIRKYKTGRETITNGSSTISIAGSVT